MDYVDFLVQQSEEDRTLTDNSYSEAKRKGQHRLYGANESGRDWPALSIEHIFICIVQTKNDMVYIRNTQRHSDTEPGGSSKHGTSKARRHVADTVCV